MKNTCYCYVIVSILIIVLVGLAIMLPIVLIHKFHKDDRRDSTRSWGGDSGDYDNDNDDGFDIDINMYDKNKLPNNSLSDIVRQNDTKINFTSNSNDTA